MTFQEAERYILEIPKFTTKHALEHTKTFLMYLGDPQQNLKVIHVAGTNGKGSVCKYLSAMLCAEGKTTGLFTSPHLVRMTERIVINEKEVSEELFLDLFQETMQAVRQMQEAGLAHPTFFEFLFGMALLAFQREKTEYVVLETGLGGRLDATSSVEHPILSIITSIGMDHMELLGNSLAEIAAEKAGILKKGTPLIYWAGEEESNRVIEAKAEELGISCKKIGKDAFEILGIEQNRIAFSCTNAYYGNTTWTLRNIGVYQPENAMLALEAMRFLFAEKGHPDRWREALGNVVWPGRMEEIAPGVYLDGAHNLSAIERFAESLPNGGAGSMILFSAVQDKDYEKMIGCLCSRVKADCYVVTQITDKRGTNVEELAEVFRKNTVSPVEAKATLEEAWTWIMERREGRTVYCLGSLYLAGMVKALEVS